MTNIEIIEGLKRNWLPASEENIAKSSARNGECKSTPTLGRFASLPAGRVTRPGPVRGRRCALGVWSWELIEPVYFLKFARPNDELTIYDDVGRA